MVSFSTWWEVKYETALGCKKVAQAWAFWWFIVSQQQRDRHCSSSFTQRLEGHVGYIFVCVKPVIMFKPPLL